MRIKRITYGCACAVFSLVWAGSCTGEKEKVLLLSNPTHFERPDEQFSMGRNELIKFFGKIPLGKVPHLKTIEGKSIPSQTDDLNQDGIWDELSFVYTFKAGQTAMIKVLYVERSTLPVYPVRTNIRFAKQDGKGGYQEIIQENMPDDHHVETTLQRYQLEGPGWENDRIGFRNYFDSRNAMDIFGKRSEQMVLDKTDLDEKVAEYLTMQSWGMDILKVAGSLGAGALALYEKDSLYRLSGAGMTHYQLVTKGPVRSVFRMDYLDFSTGLQSGNIHHEVAIWAGAPGYQSKVWYSGFKENKILVTGMANIKNHSLEERVYDGKFVSLATHDEQAESGDKLGMALLLDKKDFLGKGQANPTGTGITQTWYAKLGSRNNIPVTFWFIAGWQGQDQRYAQASYFRKIVRQTADRLVQPIKISKL